MRSQDPATEEEVCRPADWAEGIMASLVMEDKHPPMVSLFYARGGLWGCPTPGGEGNLHQPLAA